METKESLNTVLNDLGISLPEPKSLLIVDDEPENLDVLEALFEDEFTIHTAINGAHGIEVFRKNPHIEVVISDQRMPIMTGIDMIRELKQLSPHLVSVVLTAYTDVEPMIAAINHGQIYRFLIKPFDTDEIRAVITECMDVYWQNNALKTVVHSMSKQNTNLYETHMALADTQEELVASDRLGALGRFASGIAHDVRNQISVLSMLMQMIEQKSTNHRIIKTTKEIKKDNADLLAMLETIQKIRSLSSSFSEKNAVSPDIIISQAIKKIQRTTGKRTKITEEIDPRLSDILPRLEKESMVDALATLMQNAVKLNASNRPVEICARVTSRNNLSIEVAHHQDRSAGEYMFSSGASTLLASDRKHRLNMQLLKLTIEAQGGRIETTSDESRRITRLLFKIPKEHSAAVPRSEAQPLNDSHESVRHPAKKETTSPTSQSDAEAV